jgi:polar amino acid transport system permease protein
MDFDYSFRWLAAFKALPDMLLGTWVTLQTTVLSMVFGILIALALTAMQTARQAPLRHFANAVA